MSACIAEIGCSEWTVTYAGWNCMGRTVECRQAHLAVTAARPHYSGMIRVIIYCVSRRECPMLGSDPPKRRGPMVCDRLAFHNIFATL